MSSLGEQIDVRHRRQRRRLVVAGLLSASAVVVAVALLISYSRYHEWPWSTYPSTLEWCGRTYDQTPGIVKRAALSAAWRQVGNVPGWLNSGEVWSDRNGCGSLPPVAVRGDGDRFKRYSPEGGP